VTVLIVAVGIGWGLALGFVGAFLVTEHYLRRVVAERDLWCDRCHRAWRDAIDLQAAYDRARRELADRPAAGEWWQEGG
jgi:hypothetical protein